MGADWFTGPLISWTAERASRFSSELFIVAKEKSKYAGLGYPVLLDESSEQVPLAGIITALERRAGWSLLLSCDTPLVKPGLLELLWQKKESGKICACRTGGRLNPFPALYPNSILPFFKKAFAEGKWKLQRLLEEAGCVLIEEMEVKKRDPDLVSFINVNSKEDLKKLEKLFIDFEEF